MKTGRLLFLDIVRAYACIMMVFGHTFDALIHKSLRSTCFFTNWQHFRGLTAPTFLFVSGFAFFIATTRYWNEYLRATPRLLKRLRRVFYLLFIGYMLHFPVKDPLDIFRGNFTTSSWISWMGIDILQCVALNLFILHLLIYLLRTKKRFMIYTSIAMPSIFFLSPWIWKLNGHSSSPNVWNFYIGGNFNSLFPLVPWIGFMYAGIIAGWFYKEYLKENQRWLFHFARIGLVIVGIGITLWAISLQIQIPSFPNLFMPSLWIRLGAVILIFSVISYTVRKMHNISPIIQTMGAETLTIYWMHLVVIYGSAWNLGLVQKFGQSLSPLSCFAIFVILFSALTTIVIYKNKIKAKLKTLAKSIAINIPPKPLPEKIESQ